MRLVAHSLSFLLICAFLAVDGAPKGDQAADDALHLLLDTADLTDQGSARRVFNMWGQKHGKKYASADHEQRAQQRVLENAQKVRDNRRAARTGAVDYRLSLNKFSDLTFEEFRMTKLGFIKPRQIAKRAAPLHEEREKRATLPASLNWVTQGFVTPVKMQGQCGCCWTFASTGAIEAQYFKKFRQLLSFSEEEFVECVTEYAGCGGGDVTTAFDYVSKIGGLATETSYPFTAQDGMYGSCKTASTPQVKFNVTYTYLETDAQLLTALASVGPIPVAVAVADNFMLYSSGVMDPGANCGPPADVNHAVLLVGYGVDPVTLQTYWLLKNSWDTDWGEAGYFRVLRSVTNSCGISTYPIQVTLV